MPAVPGPCRLLCFLEAGTGPLVLHSLEVKWAWPSLLCSLASLLWTSGIPSSDCASLCCYNSTHSSPNWGEMKSFSVLQTLNTTFCELYLCWQALLSLNSASGPFGSLILSSFVAFLLSPCGPALTYALARGGCSL